MLRILMLPLGIFWLSRITLATSCTIFSGGSRWPLRLFMHTIVGPSLAATPASAVSSSR